VTCWHRLHVSPSRVDCCLTAAWDANPNCLGLKYDDSRATPAVLAHLDARRRNVMPMTMGCISPDFLSSPMRRPQQENWRNFLGTTACKYHVDKGRKCCQKICARLPAIHQVFYVLRTNAVWASILLGMTSQLSSHHSRSLTKTNLVVTVDNWLKASPMGA